MMSSFDRTPVWVWGAGKMAESLFSLSAQEGFEVLGAISPRKPENKPFLVFDKAKKGMGKGVIDFSTPKGFESALNLALEENIPFLSGTTGLDSRHHEALKEASSSIPLLHTTNTSPTVALLARFGREASRILSDADIEIIETHHRDKKDAPSGTAYTLLSSVAKARKIQPEEVLTLKREQNQPRKKGSIGIQSVRGGGVVGVHQMMFLMDEEYLEISHHAQNRNLFARGAWHLFSFLLKQKAGHYTMDDFLDAKLGEKSKS